MISLGSGSLLLAGKAMVEDVGRRSYVEALVGAGCSPEIVTSSRANISFLDSRDLRGRVACGRGASEVFAGIPRFQAGSVSAKVPMDVSGVWEGGILLWTWVQEWAQSSCQPGIPQESKAFALGRAP